MENRNDFEISLLDLLAYLKKKLWILLLAVILGGALGFAGSMFLIRPVYTASTRMYVLNRSQDTVAYSDFQVSSQMLNDYKVLITGRNVTEKVVQQMKLDLTPEELARQITVSSPRDTRVLQVSVENRDPVLAAEIANLVREIASGQIKEIMDADAVKLVYEAAVPLQPSAPSIPRYTVLAAALALLAAAAILIAVFVMDDTIRTEEDVEKYLGLSTLGVIPNASDLMASGAPGKHRGLRRQSRQEVQR